MERKLRNFDKTNPLRISLNASFQGVKILFVLAFNDTFTVNNNTETDDPKRVKKDSHRKYFPPRVNITNYNVLIDGINFYDQLIGDQIKKYDEIRKIATGQEGDYTTECLLDYQNFKDQYQVIVVNLSKQKELNANPGGI